MLTLHSQECENPQKLLHRRRTQKNTNSEPTKSQMWIFAMLTAFVFSEHILIDNVLFGMKLVSARTWIANDAENIAYSK